MTTQNGQAQEYKISEATLIADRLGSEEYNLTALVGELNLFEDIERPYVTGQIVFMDDIGIVDEVRIRGSEQIRLTVESIPSGNSAGVDSNLKFTLVMNLVSIIQSTKVSDKTEVYHVNLISPHAFRDANTKISRSYTGKLENISQAILKNHLDVDTDLSYIQGWTSSQSPVKIITPYISPLESVEWLLSRASTLIGCPLYCWQTIYDQVEGRDTVRMGSLEFMMNAPAFNANKHMRYSAALAQSVADKPLVEQAFTVKSIQAENTQDTLKMVHEGVIGSNLASVDTFTGQSFQRHFDITDQLSRLENMRVVPYGAEQNVFDGEQELEFSGISKPINEWDSRYFSTITSYGTYGSVNSYHDVQDPSEALNKLRVRSVKSMLSKNMMQIVVPGITFFSQLANGNSGVSAGDTIWIDFLNSDVEEETVLNTDLSGKYLIHTCRNIYKDTVHEIVCSISKIATNPPKLVG
jgi:hypothetical protein